MIDVNELRKGVTIELDGALLKVIDYEHNKARSEEHTSELQSQY